ncbi:MAG: glycosyltransferase family 9 protein, partial [Planctomycetota bacterium]
RVLLCLRWGIGDVVMATPSYRALRQRFPSARIVVLGAKPATDFFDAGDVADEVHAVQDFGVAHWGDRSAEASRRLTEWFAGRPSFDWIVDALHAAPAVQDVLREQPGNWLDGHQPTQHRLTREGIGLTEAVNRAAEVGWGFPVASPGKPRVSVRREDDVWADEQVQTTPGSMTAVAPVASMHLKRWPAERFAAVCDDLLHDGPVLLFVGPERDVADEVLSHMRSPERVRIVGPEHLLRQAALLRRCDRFLGNDTGLMHMAAAMGVATVGLFGPTSRRIVLPRHGSSIGLGDARDCPHFNDQQLDMPACWAAGHCLHSEPRSCIDRISVDDARSSLRRLGGVGGGDLRLPVQVTGSGSQSVVGQHPPA